MRRRPDPALGAACDTCAAETGAACTVVRRGIGYGGPMLGYHAGRAAAALAPIRRVRALRDARDDVARWRALAG